MKIGKKIVYIFAAVFCLSFFCRCASTQKTASHAAKTHRQPALQKTSERASAALTNGKLTMYFIDLDVPKDSEDKSGDSTLVVSPDGKTMLIDCGHPDAGKDVVRLLRSLGIDKIDIVVISHPHIDHLGAFPLIARTFPIAHVYRSRLEYDTRYTRAFDAAVKAHDIPSSYLEAGDSFSFGDKVRVDIFGPAHEIVYPKNYPANATQFINDCSISMMLVYGQSKALFCGDLYRSGETTVLDAYEAQLKCDVAKANHHGNATSSRRRWIKATNPDVIVAMNDVLGSMDVVNDYVKYGSKFYHTLYNGSIKVEMDDKHTVTVTPEKESWIEKLAADKK
ncbi:ComEC/Rec2 family competence protein [Treponema socranskii]|nr:MBL fold metallo-hydrolase [Treponema socranskii]